MAPEVRGRARLPVEAGDLAHKRQATRLLLTPHVSELHPILLATGSHVLSRRGLSLPGTRKHPVNMRTGRKRFRHPAPASHAPIPQQPGG